MDLKKLGEVLRKKREDLGVPAAELARRAEIGRNTVWALERGENPKTGKPSRPSKDKLERWVKVLRMDQQEQEEVLGLAGYDADVQRSAIPKVERGGRRRGLVFSSGFAVGAKSRTEVLKELLRHTEEITEIIKELLQSEEDDQ